MNCSDVLYLAPLYLAGELDSTRAEQLAAHARICPSCARELEQQQAFDSLLRESVLAEPCDSSRVEVNVRRSIAQQLQRGKSRRWLFAFAVAAGVLLSVAVIRTVFSSPAVPIYAAAAQDHRVEIVDRQPRNWFTDRASIEALAKRQGVSRYAIDAIAPAGYRLAQGKLCRLDGKVFLHLVYVSDALNFSVFLRPADAVAAVHTETRGAEHVAGFQNRKVNALFVTEQTGDAALRLARSAAADI